MNLKANGYVDWRVMGFPQSQSLERTTCRLWRSLDRVKSPRYLVKVFPGREESL